MLEPSAASHSSPHSLDRVSHCLSNHSLVDPALEASSHQSSEAERIHLSDPQSLLKLTNRMTHILQAMPSGIVILNANGVISQVNPMACQLLEETGSSVSVPSVDNALSTSLVGQSWRQVIKHAFLPQNDDGYEVSLRSGRRVSIATRSLTPEPGQLIVLTDLTETRQLQKNVSHLQRLSALGKIVATLAHQIRTPLAAAILYADNLSHKNISTGIRDKFQQKLMHRLGEIELQVSDMLLTVKGNAPALNSVTELKGIIDNVLENCIPIAKKNACQLTFSNNSQGQIKTNVQVLVSAINNLLINSIEAGATEITLQTYDDGRHVVVEIVDDGSGLMQSEQVSASPFFTTKPQGTGLGLSVVQSVMCQHNGEVTLGDRHLNGHVQKGCRVLLRFPKIGLAGETGASSALQEEVAHG